MYRSSSGHLVYSFRVAAGGGGGGVFRNFRVIMCRWDTGTPSLYFWFSWMFLFYTKLPKFLPIQELLSLYPVTDLAAWTPYPIKRHIMYPICQYPPPPPSGGLGCPLSSFITNFKESRETIHIHIHTRTCNKKKMHFSFLLGKLKPASYFIFQTF